MKYIFYIFFFKCAFSQSIISGLVQNKDGEPVSYVSVYIEGNLDGATTNEKGTFEFKTKRNGECKLVFYFMGYKKKSVTLKLPKNVYKKVILEESVERSDIVNVDASAYITDSELKAVIARPLDVVTTPGAQADITKFYQTMPGVTTVDEGAGLFVRGGHVSETMMIIDGATLIHPYRFESASGGFMGTISPFLTDGSAFYTGALSAKYGNILSGIVDMKSFGLNNSDSYTMGVGLAAYSLMTKKSIVHDKLSIAFSGNYSDTKSLMNLNGSRTEFIKYPESYDLNLNLNFHFSKTGKLKLFLFKEHNEIGMALQ